MSDKKKVVAPAPTFLKSVAKATDVRATMKGLGKMCSFKTYGG